MIDCIINNKDKPDEWTTGNGVSSFSKRPAKSNGVLVQELSTLELQDSLNSKIITPEKDKNKSCCFYCQLFTAENFLLSIKNLNLDA